MAFHKAILLLSFRSTENESSGRIDVSGNQDLHGRDESGTDLDAGVLQKFAACADERIPPWTAPANCLEVTLSAFPNNSHLDSSRD
jgi:hypothetical protein